MELKELENTLKLRRIEAYKAFKSNLYGSRNLQPSVVRFIEDGNNYKFNTLLKFITALNYKLYVNGMHIKEPKDLGMSIKKFRKDRKLTQFQMLMICNFEPSKMVRMEKGQCSRNSLEAMMNHFPDFKMEIKDIYDE